MLPEGEGGNYFGEHLFEHVIITIAVSQQKCFIPATHSPSVAFRRLACLNVHGACVFYTRTPFFGSEPLQDDFNMLSRSAMILLHYNSAKNDVYR